VTDRGSHEPVMVDAVVAALAPRNGDIMIDATFGAGGYARALLEAAPCRVSAIDRDPAAIARSAALAARYGQRFHAVEGRFSEMATLLAPHDVAAADGVAFDLGVSSPQIDDPARGFSFQADGPLDMRMTPSGSSAADFVNTAAETTIADVIYRFGEERHARRIARAIVRRRRERPLARTGELVDAIVQAVGPQREGERLHPATRTFQALRIHINDELTELRLGLAASERLLRSGGRLAVVAFHSLEDRIVKQFLTERSGRAPKPGRHQPFAPARAPSFAMTTRKALRPSEAEVARNPRARSARFRSAVRTEAPAWSSERGQP